VCVIFVLQAAKEVLCCRHWRPILFIFDGMRLVTIVFCLGSMLSNAQDFGATLLASANFSQVDGDQLGGYNKLGANFGIQINREINDDWEAAFEIRFSMKGAKKVIDPEIPQPTLKLSYHYVEVPLLAKYTKYNKVTPYGGLSIGVNVFNERNDNGITSEEEALQPVEVGFVIGATYHLTEKMGIDLRHSYSVVSIRDYPIRVNSPTVFGRAGWYNRLFTVGLTLNLGK
jgi:opacity protein-like surface antigen